MTNPSVGVVVGADYLPAKALLQYAPQIEALGYSQISVPEIWGHDSISLLANLAYITKSARLSTGILNMYSRTPGVVGMTAVSLDELSGGRFTVGLGLSGPKVIEGFHGRKFTKPLQHTRDFVTMLRLLLSGQRLDYQSDTLGLVKGFKLSVNPVRENQPIHIASLGPKNVKLTTEIADGWIPVIMPLNAFKEEVQTVYKHLDEFNKPRDSFQITPFVLAGIGSDPKTKLLLQGHLAYYFGGMGTFYNNMLKRIGYEEEAEDIRLKWLNGDRQGAALSVTDEILNQTCLMGSKNDAIEQLVRIMKAGATTPLVTVPFGSTVEMAVQTFTALAPNGIEI